MNKIRKGDQVIVTDRSRQGQARHRDPAASTIRPCRRRRRQRRQEARQAEPDEGHHRRRDRQDHAHPPVERGDLQRGHRQGRPRGRQAARWTARRSASSSPAAKRSRLSASWRSNSCRLLRPRLAPPRRACRQIYREKIVPDLMAKFGYKSTMQVPRLQKITLNMGVSEAVSDKKVMDTPSATSPRSPARSPWSPSRRRPSPVSRSATNVPIGCMVTLRGVRMYEFLDRFVTVALPRVRDFRGISGRRSTAAATTTSASRSRSSSPRSSTTRSTRSVA
jgi:hypothetical protein